MPLFDAYIFVDWSSLSQSGPAEPAADSIWVGECFRGGYESTEAYCSTRNLASMYLMERLSEHVGQRRRVLLGFDFAYGYPAGFAAALGLPANTPAWRAVWDAMAVRITDDDANRNNRFQVAGQINATVRAAGHPGPYWGRHHQVECADVPLGPHGDDPIPTLTGIPLPNYRITEQRAGGQIKSSWQLFFPGSVGGQVLTGLPHLRKLRFEEPFCSCSQVWPFETGFTPVPVPLEGPYILHAEIWPSIAADAVGELMSGDPDLIKDEAQVRVLCQWAHDQDTAGMLGAFFETPAHLSMEQIQQCVTEEGWILGVR